MASRICDELQLTWLPVDLVAVVVAVAVFAVILGAAKDPEGLNLPRYFHFFNRNLNRRCTSPTQKETYTAWPSVPNQVKGPTLLPKVEHLS
jgi:hypothetical protein